MRRESQWTWHMDRACAQALWSGGARALLRSIGARVAAGRRRARPMSRGWAIYQRHAGGSWAANESRHGRQPAPAGSLQVWPARTGEGGQITVSWRCRPLLPRAPRHSNPTHATMPLGREAWPCDRLSARGVAGHGLGNELEALQRQGTGSRPGVDPAHARGSGQVDGGEPWARKTPRAWNRGRS